MVVTGAPLATAWSAEQLAGGGASELEDSLLEFFLRFDSLVEWLLLLLRLNLSRPLNVDDFFRGVSLLAWFADVSAEDDLDEEPSELINDRMVDVFCFFCEFELELGADLRPVLASSGVIITYGEASSSESYLLAPCAAAAASSLCFARSCSFLVSVSRSILSMSLLLLLLLWLLLAVDCSIAEVGPGFVSSFTVGVCADGCGAITVYSSGSDGTG